MGAIWESHLFVVARAELRRSKLANRVNFDARVAGEAVVESVQKRCDIYEIEKKQFKNEKLTFDRSLPFVRSPTSPSVAIVHLQVDVRRYHGAD